MSVIKISDDRPLTCHSYRARLPRQCGLTLMTQRYLKETLHYLGLAIIPLLPSSLSPSFSSSPLSPPPPPLPSQVYAVMDLEDFEHTFSAYQPNMGSPTLSATIRRRSKLLADKPKELSVIDGRKAQNCTIILSKLKMSDSSIRQAVLTMDSGGKLSKDMLEQLLKFVPTSAEVELLESHIAEEETFARADHFLLEMSRSVIQALAHCSIAQYQSCLLHSM